VTNGLFVLRLDGGAEKTEASAPPVAVKSFLQIARLTSCTRFVDFRNARRLRRSASPGFGQA
jgi:hypothetical protein